MNRYSYHWRDSMRLRAGLTWRTNRPTMADYPSVPKCILLLLLVLILWSWAMDRDYAEQAGAEIERQTAIAEKRANQLGECIQGDLRLIGEDGIAIACRRAEQFKI